MYSFLKGLLQKVLWIIVLVHRFPDLVQLFPKNFIIAGTVAARLTMQSMTTDFTDSGWWEVNCTYQLLCVGLKGRCYDTQ